MNHLDEVAGAVGANVGDARLALGDCGNRSKDGAEGLVCLCATARHDRRALECALFAARDTGANEVDSLGADLFFAADGVGPEGVSAVDHDIVGGKQGQEAVDYSVGGFAGLNENNNLAGECDRLDEFLEGLRADDTAGGAGIFGDELVGFFDSAVVN